MEKPHHRHERNAAASSDFAAGFNDFNQLALWTAATLSGMVTAMLAARTPFFQTVIKRLYPHRSPLGTAKRPTRGESLPMLADAVIGSPREMILAVFGPPRAAVIDTAAALGTEGIWGANTWYYPLPKNGKMAMAIGFEQDTARQVDFFNAPKHD